MEKWVDKYGNTILEKEDPSAFPGEIIITNFEARKGVNINIVH
jgi:hypothetical protein